MMKVIVSYICPPIGVRSFDWQATLDRYNGDEPNAPRGFGVTKYRAMEDLLSQLDDSDEYDAVVEALLDHEERNGF